jgi:excisionase family DNA binding protein
MEPVKKNLLTTAQAAKYLKTTRRSIQRYILAGRLKSIPVGRQSMVTRADCRACRRPRMGRPFKKRPENGDESAL